jgi:hypothetical protein
MRVTLTVDCDNDAFANDPAAELARILRDAADKFSRNGVNIGDESPLFDVNGNRTGYFQVSRGVFATVDYRTRPTDDRKEFARKLAENPQSALSRGERAKLRRIAAG